MQTTRSIEFRGKRLSLAGRRGDAYFENVLANDPTGDMLTQIACSGLRSDSIVFDVGANIGLTAVSLATLLPQSQIFCFEPSPTAWPNLIETIRLNGLTNQCRPFNMALGKQRGQSTFADYPDCPCVSHLVDGSDTLSEARGRPSSPEVTVSTVDSIRSELKLDCVDFIKIDVEGFEADVLAGAAESIRQCSPLILAEFNSFTLIAFKNSNPRSVLEQWMSLFREIYWTSNGQLVRICDPTSLKNFIHDNLIRHGCVNDLLCVPHGYRGSIKQIEAPQIQATSAPVGSPTVKANLPKRSAWRNVKTWISRLKGA